MVRAEYDWNEFFGRSDADMTARAPFEFMFRFTGNSAPPLPRRDGGSSRTLPENWGADWARLIELVPDHLDRSARRIDTRLAPPLHSMINEVVHNAGAEHDVRPNLPARNLRRGMLMNLPSAQGCIAALHDGFGISFRVLDEKELTRGRTGDLVHDLGFHRETPLWFYVLKEAEVIGNGQRLGPLGSHIVAGTIAGLMVHDPQSAWNKAGSLNGRWHPVDGPKVSGFVVDSLPALLRAAGVL